MRDLCEILHLRPSDVMAYEGAEHERLLFDLAVMSSETISQPFISDTGDGRKKVNMSLREYLLRKYGGVG